MRRKEVSFQISSRKCRVIGSRDQDCEMCFRITQSRSVDNVWRISHDRYNHRFILYSKVCDCRVANRLCHYWACTRILSYGSSVLLTIFAINVALWIGVCLATIVTKVFRIQSGTTPNNFKILLCQNSGYSKPDSSRDRWRQQQNRCIVIPCQMPHCNNRCAKTALGGNRFSLFNYMAPHQGLPARQIMLRWWMLSLGRGSALWEPRFVIGVVRGRSLSRWPCQRVTK